MYKQTEVVAYKVIENDLKGKICNGNIKPGERLPSMVDLCQEYNTSSTTVKKSLDSLKQAGYIYAKKRVGYFVSDIESDNFKIKFNLQDNLSDTITNSEIENVTIIPGDSETKGNEKTLKIGRVFYNEILPSAFENLEIALRSNVNPDKINVDNWIKELESVLYSQHIHKGINVSLVQDQMINEKLMVPDETLLFHFIKTFETTAGRFIARSGVYIPNNVCKISGSSVQIRRGDQSD